MSPRIAAPAGAGHPMAKRLNIGIKTKNETPEVNEFQKNPHIYIYILFLNVYVYS